MNKVHKGQMYSRLKLGIAIGLSALVALTVAGCGVRGSLETPRQQQSSTGDATPGKPGGPVPHKPSILDPLLR